MSIAFVCPHCGKQLNVPEQYLGQSGTCNFCKSRITILVTPPQLPKRSSNKEMLYDEKAENDLSLRDHVLKQVQNHKRRDDISSTHFALMEIMQEHYKKRDTDPAGLYLSIWACKLMIDIAPKFWDEYQFEDRQRDERLGLDHKPVSLSHPGFEQLSIIREKQGRIDEAIGLCVRAKAQGWRGDWDKRIQRLQKRASKSK